MTTPTTWEGLTRMESEVARRIALGEARDDIAAALDISVKTYDTHRMHVLRKLRLQNVVQLARLALRRGYVTLDEQAVSS